MNKQQSSDDKKFSSGDNLIYDIHQVHHVHHEDAILNFDNAVNAKTEAFTIAKAVIDQALIDCEDTPGVLASDAFQEAIKLIKTDKALWLEYRVKIKKAKPGGVLMSEIDAMAVNESNEGSRQDSTAAALIALVLEQGTLFFDNQADKSFANVRIYEADHTLAIGSKAFVEWLSYSYYTATKKNDAHGMSASEAAIKQACFALAGIARHDGQQERVYLRCADFNGGHYIFVGDQELNIIEVLPSGWRVTKESPVYFWKPASMQSLPMPVNGGDLSRLWEFINIPDQDRLLVLAWILECYRVETPKPILALTGTHGSVKSSSQDKLRQLIDNNAVNLRGVPKTVEDVYVSAGNNRLCSYENLSHLTATIQDAFCTLATGGGHAGRKFYTNDEESIIDVKRPIICNSIPSVLTRQDITDRSITLELPRLEYREESEINAAWDCAKPAIFGALLDLFVKTLAKMSKVKLINPPRMADFTRLGEAMSQALGYQSGTFDRLYKANRQEGISRTLEASPVAVAIREMAENHNYKNLPVFNDTMKALLERLEAYKKESHAWPKSPRGLGDIIRRQQPALASLGIDIEISKPGKHGVNVEIRKGEHGEHGERGKTDFHDQKYIKHPESAAFDTEVF